MTPAPENARRPVLADDGGYQRFNPDTAFEPSDWRLAPVALAYVGTLIVLVASCLVLKVAYPRALPDVARTLSITPPGPFLQTDPQGEFERIRADEEKRRDTYYWIDKSKGVVHVPVEQAMQNLAKTGIPGFPKGEQ